MGLWEGPGGYTWHLGELNLCLMMDSTIQYVEVYRDAQPVGRWFRWDAG